MVGQDGGRVFYYDGSGYPPPRGYNPRGTALILLATMDFA